MIIFLLKKIKMMSLIFDGILLCPKQQIDIFDIENYLFNKSGIPMKVSIKPFKDYFSKFGESNIINIKEYNKNYKNKIFVNKKVIHHMIIQKKRIILSITFAVIVT